MGAGFWNERYGVEEFAYGTAPNAFLAAQLERLYPTMWALVPGDGEGRNGVWLAQQGLTVTTVDLSTAGVAKAEALAAARGVSLRAEVADLTTWSWPMGCFDLVVSVYLHFPPHQRPDIHGRMVEALAPGGLLILEGFRPEHLDYRRRFGTVGGPPRGELCFNRELLQGDFASLTPLLLEDADVDLDEGPYHRGRSAVVRGVWQK
ncbi:MAG: SAM-dependent methyltransferase [Candidatus Competibacterales bacterium]